MLAKIYSPFKIRSSKNHFASHGSSAKLTFCASVKMIAAVFVFCGLISAARLEAAPTAKDRHVRLVPRDETVSTHNDFVDVIAEKSTGRFVVGYYFPLADRYVPLSSRYPLSRGDEVGFESRTSFKIDGAVWVTSDDANTFPNRMGAPVMPRPTAVAEPLQAVWTQGDLQIQQFLEPVDFATKGAVRIRYVFENKSATTSHEVGVMLFLDTQIGLSGNDRAPIADGGNYSRKVRDFVGTAVPSIWQAYEYEITQPDFPGVIGEGIMEGNGAIRPDRFAICDWFDDAIKLATWDYEIPDTDYSDSVILMWWNPVTVPPLGRVEFATLYGSGIFVFRRGDLALGNSAPTAVSIYNCKYSPESFLIFGMALNTGIGTAREVYAHLALPTGLSISAGQSPTQVSPFNLGPGSSGTFAWEVKVDPAAFPDSQTVHYQIELTYLNSPRVLQDYPLFVPSLTPGVVLPEPTHDFGNIAYGDSSLPWNLRIRNKGNADLTIQTVLSSRPEFKINGTASGFTIGPCGEVSIPVIFKPSGPSTVRGVITVTDAINRYEVALIGAGLGAMISVQDTLDFEAVDIAQPLSGKKPLVIRNNGNTFLQIDSLTISPQTLFDFLIKPLQLPKIPPPQDGLNTQPLDLVFTPNKLKHETGTLVIYSNDRNRSPRVVTLTGLGIGPVITTTITDANLNFGQVRVGQTPPPKKTVTLLNASTESKTIDSLTTHNSAAFRIEKNWSTPIPMAAGATRTIDVIFDPPRSGFFETEPRITIYNSDPYYSQTQIYAQGQGIAPQIAYSTDSLKFGEVFAKIQSLTRELIVRNINLDPLSPPIRISSFKIETTCTDTTYQVTSPTQWPFELDRDQSQVVAVEFRPGCLGPINGLLTISSLDVFIPTQTVRLLGVGLGGVLSLPAARDYNFGMVPVFETADTTIFLKNGGNYLLRIDSLTTQSAIFSAQIDSILPFNIAVNGSAPVRIAFTPTAAGVANGLLRIYSSDPFNPVQFITLHGTGGRANVTFSPSDLNFGKIRVNSEVSKSVTITNDGNVSIQIAKVLIDSLHFTIKDLPSTVELNDSRTFRLTYHPKTEASHISAMQIISPQLNFRPALPLRGQGVLPHLQTVNSLAFGAVPAGEVREADLILENKGTAPLLFTDMTVASERSVFSFKEAPNRFPLIEGEKRSYTIRFQPDGGGQFNGEVRIVSDDPDAPSKTVQLTGLGDAGAEIQTAAGHDFGLVHIQSRPQWSFRIYNRGTTPLIVTGALSGWPFDTQLESGNTSATIAPNDSVGVRVTFYPQQAGPIHGEAHILSNDFNSSDVVVQLSAIVIAGNVDISTKQIEFGNVRVGTTAEWPLIIQNYGTANLILENVTFSDAHYSLSLQTPVPDVVAPLLARPLRVQFRPDQAGRGYPAEMRVYTSDAAANPLIISLNGAGIAPNIQLSGTQFNFAPTMLFQTTEQSLIVTNEGSDRLTLSGVTINPPGHFAVIGPFPQDFPPGRLVNYRLLFSPTERQSYAAGVQFLSADGQIPQINLTGRGVAAVLTLPERYHDFGRVGDRADWSFVIRNSGDGPLQVIDITNSQPQFRLVGAILPQRIEPGDSRDFTVRFTSSHTGRDAEDFLVIVSDDPFNPRSSIFVEGHESGLSVLLEDFSAEAVDAGIRVQWRVSADEPLVGCYLYRGLQAERARAGLISNGLLTGGDFFTFEDDLRDVEMADSLYYWLQALTISGEAYEFGPVMAIPPPQTDQVRLWPNWPNPFSTHTTLRYQLPVGQAVSLGIYALTGQLVRALFAGRQSAGNHQTDWDGRDAVGRPVAPGVYICRLQTERELVTRRVALLR